MLTRECVTCLLVIVLTVFNAHLHTHIHEPMESMRQQQQDGLHLDQLPHGLFKALEELRIDSPVTLDQLVQFLDAFDDIWVAYRHKIISETTVSGDEVAWIRMLSTSSPDVLDIRKQHVLSALEPRLIDCTETLMSS